MKVWFYLLETGNFTGRSFAGSQAACELNTPEGCGARADVTDWQSQRVDVEETGNLIDYQPSQPSADHAWNADTKRWQLKPEIIERNQRQAAAQSELEALDQSELRAISDVLAELPASIKAQAKAAFDNLDQVRAHKDAQRAIFKT